MKYPVCQEKLQDNVQNSIHLEEWNPSQKKGMLVTPEKFKSKAPFNLMNLELTWQAYKNHNEDIPRLLRKWEGDGGGVSYLPLAFDPWGHSTNILLLGNVLHISEGTGIMTHLFFHCKEKETQHWLLIWGPYMEGLNWV